MSKTPLTKKEFLQQYILNRALAVNLHTLNSDGFVGDACRIYGMIEESSAELCEAGPIVPDDKMPINCCHCPMHNSPDPHYSKCTKHYGDDECRELVKKWVLRQERNIA